MRCAILLTLATLGILANGCQPTRPERETAKEASSFQFDPAQTWLDSERVVTLDSDAVQESSGVAPSRLHPGEYFTHNDSGGKPEIFRFNLDGSVSATIQLPALKSVDWEDMASAELDGKPYLYVGDIGDNAGKRKHITVYRFSEPEGDSVDPNSLQTYSLRYPDEPHNAETLMVHPVTGDLVIVTKAGTKPAAVFAMPKPEKSGEYMLQKVGEITIEGMMPESRRVTGGAFSPDGRRFVLRTYLQGLEFDVLSLLGEPNGFQWQLRNQFSLADPFPGESVTYSLKGDALIVTAEGVPCPIGVAKPSGR